MMSGRFRFFGPFKTHTVLVFAKENGLRSCQSLAPRRVQIGQQALLGIFEHRYLERFLVDLEMSKIFFLCFFLSFFVVVERLVVLLLFFVVVEGFLFLLCEKRLVPGRRL